MKALTIRNVDPRLARALERETNRRATSLNQTVIELLRQALGVESGSRRSNGMRKLAGSWSARDLADFEARTKMFGDVDPELWS